VRQPQRGLGRLVLGAGGEVGLDPDAQAAQVGQRRLGAHEPAVLQRAAALEIELRRDVLALLDPHQHVDLILAIVVEPEQLDRHRREQVGRAQPGRAAAVQIAGQELAADRSPARRG
jgi:hypothetical protein